MLVKILEELLKYFYSQMQLIRSVYYFKSFIQYGRDATSSMALFFNPRIELQSFKANKTTVEIFRQQDLPPPGCPNVGI